MITDREIENKAEELDLRPIDVEKDYVYGWLLRGLFSRPALAAQFVLKGGNALRKCYLPFPLRTWK
jgi:predicted nucleotidyltransferase component of viral defense system